MILKNFQEDIVIGAINLTIKESYPKLMGKNKEIKDIAAFVLNRIPPMYVTSSRGMNHLGRTINDIANNTATHLVALINFAIQSIIERRPSKRDFTETQSEFFEVEDEMSPYLAYPQIIGSVNDAANGKPIAKAIVSLYSVETSKIAHAIGIGWAIPTFTNKFGQFCVWPKYDKIGKDDNCAEDGDIIKQFRVIVTNPEYVEGEKVIDVEGTYCFQLHIAKQFGGFLNIGEIPLAKE